MLFLLTNSHDIAKSVKCFGVSAASSAKLLNFCVVCFHVADVHANAWPLYSWIIFGRLDLSIFSTTDFFFFLSDSKLVEIFVQVLDIARSS